MAVWSHRPRGRGHLPLQGKGSRRRNIRTRRDGVACGFSLFLPGRGLKSRSCPPGRGYCMSDACGADLNRSSPSGRGAERSEAGRVRPTVSHGLRRPFRSPARGRRHLPLRGRNISGATALRVGPGDPLGIAGLGLLPGDRCRGDVRSAAGSGHHWTDTPLFHVSGCSDLFPSLREGCRAERGGEGPATPNDGPSLGAAFPHPLYAAADGRQRLQGR